MSFCAGSSTSKILGTWLLLLLLFYPSNVFYFLIDFSLHGNLTFLNQIALNNNGVFWVVFLPEVLFWHFPLVFQSEMVSGTSCQVTSHCHIVISKWSFVLNGVKKNQYNFYKRKDRINRKNRNFYVELRASKFDILYRL